MSSSSLEVPRRQRPEKRSKLWRILVILATLAVAVGWLVWFLRTPDDLPTSTAIVEGRRGRRPGPSTSACSPSATTSTGRSGSPRSRSTSTPDDERRGHAADLPRRQPQLHHRRRQLLPRARRRRRTPSSPSGDSIVLVVTASEPTEVEIGRIEISFRDGIRWGTKEAGIDGATLTFADHEPGTVEEDTEPEDPTSERPEQDDPKDRDKDKKKKEQERRTGKATTPDPSAPSVAEPLLQRRRPIRGVRDLVRVDRVGAVEPAERVLLPARLLEGVGVGVAEPDDPGLPALAVDRRQLRACAARRRTGRGRGERRPRRSSSPPSPRPGTP